MADGAIRYTTRDTMASSQSSSVASTPTRPSVRLPATTCADPGSRTFIVTSHQPRFVIVCEELASGWRRGVAVVMACGSQLGFEGLVLLLDTRLEVGGELRELLLQGLVGGGQDLDREQPGVAGAPDG